MNTSQQVKILSAICTRDEAGKHFTEIYDARELDDLVAEGLITIFRPIHSATGTAYSPEYWSVDVTDEGIALVEANPEDCDAYPNSHEGDQNDKI